MSTIHKSNGEEEVDIRTRGTGTNVKTINAVTMHASYESAMSTDTGESVTERLARICPGGGICDVNLTPKGRHYKYTPLEAIPKTVIGVIENKSGNKIEVTITSQADGGSKFYLIEKGGHREVALSEGTYNIHLKYFFASGQISESDFTKTYHKGANNYSEMADRNVDFFITCFPAVRNVKKS